jgi:hypothetical protein
MADAADVPDIPKRHAEAADSITDKEKVLATGLRCKQLRKEDWQAGGIGPDVI